MQFLKLALAAAILLSPFASTFAKAQTMDPENTLYLDTTYGRVVIQLLPEKAPKHVARIKELARKGFYDGQIFHRVIEGFMAQTGDPTGTGTGGSDMPDLPAEFNDTNFGRGAVGMARTSDPNSANSQFFICFDDCSFLNRQYTVWGQVTEGMGYVDQIRRGEPPVNPDKIVKMTVAADDKGEAPAEPKAVAQ
ncbi:MAG: peptidylprolyl isomerase [Micavibrio aeruginosavorus]|uniref:Peptidyl-prolyl cis-trans isomerase n=1 Tax=Micavibrio aeruginosavorus TaxID=349221 RepID=A0A2W5FD97_9BACT|nr:MAG: peptidylprolyl isomerase [Micavibrio aeruginosavorus]